MLFMFDQPDSFKISTYILLALSQRSRISITSIFISNYAAWITVWNVCL